MSMCILYCSSHFGIVSCNNNISQFILLFLLSWLSLPPVRLFLPKIHDEILVWFPTQCGLDKKKVYIVARLALPDGLQETRIERFPFYKSGNQHTKKLYLYFSPSQIHSILWTSREKIIARNNMPAKKKKSKSEKKEGKKSIFLILPRQRYHIGLCLIVDQNLCRSTRVRWRLPASLYPTINGTHTHIYKSATPQTRSRTYYLISVGKYSVRGKWTNNSMQLSDKI